MTPVFPLARPSACPWRPSPDYADWRTTGVTRAELPDGTPVWVVNRYADIRAALADPRLSADGLHPNMPGPSHGPDNTTAFPKMDDPEHNRRRRMLTRDFTVKRVEALRPSIQEMADTFLDEMITAGSPADLVEHYALPIPSLVISLLLGVPYADHEFFQRHSMVSISHTASDADKAVAMGEMFGYLLELLARKERQPGDDLLTRQVQEVVSGGLRREEAAVNGSLMLVAGHETTANMIALSTLTLLHHPEALARIRDTDDPAVIAGAVEELLRYLTIAHTQIYRVAAEDLTVAGQEIKAGDAVALNLPSGNFDADFLARPEEFDIGRDTGGHVAFGYGVHQCLGQTLARVELQIALPTLLRRLPELRLAVPVEELRFRQDMAVFGLYELPVAW